MIDLDKQKRIGIKQAKRTIANIYKKKKGKLNDEDRANIAKQQQVLDRWERTTPRGVHL